MPRNADLYDDDEYNDEEQTQPTPKDLRAALKKANDKNAELAKQVEELAKANKANKLTELMSTKKVPANIQRWMKRDEVDATPEAVDKWLEENGSDFGWNPEGESTDEKPGEQSGTQPEAKEVPAQQGVLTEQDIAAHIQFQQMGQAPSDAPSVDPVKSAVDRVAANVNLNTPFEQVVAQLRASGVPIGGDIQIG